MSKRLEIQLFGPVSIALDGVPVTGLRSRKAEALLVYLACQKRPYSREALADLLWDDRPQDQALANLRSLLSGLNKQLGAFLTVTRHTVSFNLEADYWLDADAFARLLGAGDWGLGTREQGLGIRESSISNLQALEEAAALYRGDFLEGFYLRDCRGFEEWASLERERLCQLGAKVLQELVQYHLAHGSYAQGIHFADQLLVLNNLSERANRDKMLLLARSGQRNVALKQYDAYRQLLHEELGVAPAAETTAVYKRIKSSQAAPLHNLPPQATPFVGRTQELDDLQQHLIDPTCRLLTLLGPGGIGKTRLALAAAERIMQQQPGLFLHGIRLVPLTSVPTPDLLVTAVADVCDLTLQGQEPPLQQLLNYLQDKEMLLVLDNFEHLLSESGVDFISTMLQTCPNVKLLVTSRESLQLYEETVIALDGLQTAAATLFTEHAARVRGQPLPDGDPEPINRICDLLAGVPLALELAAGQTRTQAVAAIAAQIAETLTALQTTLRNLPPRQRSLRAAFDYSWGLLPERLQAQLARLALFVGDFASEAAHAVGVDAAALRALVTKSLLQPQQDNRFALHSLIREFADEKLQGAQRSVTANQFCDYFARTFVHWSKALGRDLTTEALAAWRLDQANVVQAWRLAIAGRDALALLRLNTPLGKFHDWHNWYGTAEMLYTEAANALTDWRDTDGRELEAYGDILLRQAWFVFVQGRIHEAIELMAQAEPVVQRGGDRHSIEIWRRTLLQMVIKAGDYAHAQTLANALLADSDPTQNPENHANRLFDSFHVFTATGDYDRAAALLNEALEIFEELGDTRRVQMCWYALGNLARAQGDYERAILLLRDCLAARADLDDSKSVANTQGTLADALYAAGELDEAQQLAEAACETYAELNDKIGWPYPLNVLGNIARDRGDKETAVTHYRTALQMAEETNRQMKVAELLLDWLLLLEDDLERNFFWGGLVTIAGLESAEYEERRRAQQHLDRRTSPSYPLAIPLSALKKRVTGIL